MASAAATFTQTWRIGRPVREKAAPHRKGTIHARQDTGPGARITVSIPGGHPATFAPAQLTPL